jgi:hypothetical protein
MVELTPLHLNNWILNHCLKNLLRNLRHNNVSNKALFIAQSPDLGFNHVLSLVIPYDFVINKKCVIKATLNAYIPTQNVAELYKQYVEKPKKKL